MEKPDISRRAVLASALPATALVGLVPGSFQPVVPLSMPSAVGKSVTADPNSFAGIDPTGNENSQPGLQKAMDATPEGGTLIIPEGTYRVDGTLSNRGRSITIYGYGATLVKNRNSILLSLQRGFEPLKSVISVQPVTVTTSSQNGQPGVQVLVPAGAVSGWKRGDVVKIVADDPIPGARNSAGETISRVGQFMHVHETSNSSVTLLGSMIDPYTANIRMARLREGLISLHGLTLKTSDYGMQANYNTGMIIVRSAQRPIIQNVTILSSPTAAINFTSCFAYAVQNVHVNLALDDTAKGSYGYGIVDNSSSLGKITGLHAQHVRHAYTDDPVAIAANVSSVENYGRTIGTEVTASTCAAATTSGFDTHHGSAQVSFSDCKVYDSPYGFSLRGRRHEVSNCEVRNCPTGVHIFSEEGGESWGHRLIGLRISGCTSAGVRIHINQLGMSAGLFDGRPNFVHGLIAEECGRDALYVRNGALHIADTYISLPTDVLAATRAVYQENASLYADNITFDLRNVKSGENIDIWSVTGEAGTTSTQLESRHIKILTTTESAQRLRHVVVTSGSPALRIDDLELANPLTRVWNAVPEGSYINWHTANRSTGAGVIRADRWDVSEVGLARSIAATSETSVVVYSDPMGVERYLVPLPPAVFQGQRLVIYNIGTTQAIIVRHGDLYGTRLVGSAERRVLRGTSAELIAGPNNLWYEVAR